MPAKTSKQPRRKSASKPAGPVAGIELGWLGGTIGFNLRIAQEASGRTFLGSVAGTGALPWHFGILTLIDLNPGLTQVALARAIRRDTSSLTSVLDDLCKRGLVSRVRPDHDRRSYALRLTPDGLKAMEKLKAKVHSHEKELDRMFTRDQRSLLIAMLNRIASELDND